MMNVIDDSCSIMSTQEILDGFDVIRTFPFIEECEEDENNAIFCPDDFDE